MTTRSKLFFDPLSPRLEAAGHQEAAQGPAGGPQRNGVQTAAELKDLAQMLRERAR